MTQLIKEFYEWLRDMLFSNEERHRRANLKDFRKDLK